MRLYRDPRPPARRSLLADVFALIVITMPPFYALVWSLFGGGCLTPYREPCEYTCDREDKRSGAWSFCMAACEDEPNHRATENEEP